MKNLGYLALYLVSYFLLWLLPFSPTLKNKEPPISSMAQKWHKIIINYLILAARSFAIRNSATLSMPEKPPAFRVLTRYFPLMIISGVP